MIKRISLLQRKPELTHEEFVNHWFKIHGALARKVPGVRRYMQNHIREISSRADIPDLDMEIDGIAELWWDDADAMKVSIATPEAQAMFADGALIIGRIKTFVIAEEAIIDDAS